MCGECGLRDRVDTVAVHDRFLSETDRGVVDIDFCCESVRRVVISATVTRDLTSSTSLRVSTRTGRRLLPTSASRGRALTRSLDR